MKYARYFKGVLNNKGLPNLNAEQWARLMNIGAIEYGITRLEKVKETVKNSSEPYKYDLMILKEKEIISGLTQDLSPGELMREMIEDSNE